MPTISRSFRSFVQAFQNAGAVLRSSVVSPQKPIKIATRSQASDVKLDSYVSWQGVKTIAVRRENQHDLGVSHADVTVNGRPFQVSITSGQSPRQIADTFAAQINQEFKGKLVASVSELGFRDPKPADAELAFIQLAWK